MAGRRLWLGAATALIALTLPAAAHPEAAAHALVKARLAVQHGDGIAAEVLLKQALTSGAGKADVAALMGEALLDQGEPDRAREWLGPGEFAKGDAAYGWRMLGQLERIQDNFAAAAKAYDKALAANPDDPLVWVDVASLRYRVGNQFQAVDAAERALAIDPDNARALDLRAQMLRDQAGFAAALPLYEHGLELAPDDLSLLGGYAGCLGELGRAAAMLAVTRHMIDLAPKQPLPWYLQAVLAARAGKVELARRLLQHAGDGLRNVPAAMLLQGALELEAGNANVAVAYLERLSDIQPANPRADLLLARALYEAGLLDELVGRFAARAARPDAPSYLLTVLARAYEEQGDRIAAAALLDRAASAAFTPIMPIAERAPLDVLARQWRDSPVTPGGAVPYVRGLLSVRDSLGAQRVADEFLKARPGSSEAAALAGDVALSQGRGTEAFPLYGQATRVRFPDRLLLRIGEALDQTGRGAAAQPLVANFLAAFPGSQLAARLAASQSALTGNWGQAAALLANLRQRGGNRDTRLLSDLSLAQLRNGDARSALASAERAGQLQPNSGVAAQARAMALIALKRDLPAAGQLLVKARQIDGDNPLLAQFRAKLAAQQR